MSVTDLISIVDADPDLGDLLDESELERARRQALTRERRLSPGDWDATGAIEPLAVALAIAHHQRVDDRLLLTLWHLAERWGRVRPEGIVLPLPLSHQRLADLVGAHRPSVTKALGELAEKGAISRREDGVWILHGAPPAQLRHHRLVAAMT